MITKNDLGGGRNSRRAYLREKLLWAGNPAEDHWRRRSVEQCEFPLHSPDKFSPQRWMIGRQFGRQHNRIRASER